MAGRTQRWRRIAEIIDAALGLEGSTRDAYLEDACNGDRELRDEIASLLDAHDRPGPVDRLAADFAPLAARVRESAASGGAPLEGRAVGRYQVQERIAGGGMGVVHRALDTRLDRTVALKFLQPRLEADDSAARRFRLEARAIEALEHPNICTIHEIGETDDGQLFLAMPLYDGETLQERIARGSFPFSEVVSVGVQVARALARAHAHGIVHRDIKPSNVMVLPDGMVKLLDFGIAKLVDITLTGAAGPLGTLAYMSPEQARSERVDHRTDIWSLGIVLYEMITGRRPYGGRSAHEAAQSLRYRPAVPPRTHRPDVPPLLEHVVLKALAVPVSQRIQSAHELEVALLDTGLASRTLPEAAR